MILDEWWQQVAVAVIGGVAAECLHWYMLARQPGGASRFRKHAVYWVTTGIMVLLGGIMPLLYISGAASSALCFHLGAATPILLQKLASAAPQLAGAMGTSANGAP